MLSKMLALHKQYNMSFSGKLIDSSNSRLANFFWSISLMGICTTSNKFWNTNIVVCHLNLRFADDYGYVVSKKQKHVSLYIKDNGTILLNVRSPPN